MKAIQSWLASEQGRVALALVALLAAAPLLARPAEATALSTWLGWGLLAAAIVLPLAGRIGALAARKANCTTTRG